MQLNTQNIGYVCYPQLHEPCNIFTYFTGTRELHPKFNLGYLVAPLESNIDLTVALRL